MKSVKFVTWATFIISLIIFAATAYLVVFGVPYVILNALVIYTGLNLIGMVLIMGMAINNHLFFKEMDYSE